MLIGHVVKTDPPGGVAATRYANADLLDSYAIVLPKGVRLSAHRVAELTLGDQSAVVRWLMATRDRIMTTFGVMTSEQIRQANDLQRIDYFPIISNSDSEIELGLDDRHLDFRTWVTLNDEKEGLKVRVTTVVRTHNFLGRAYLAVVRPFHAAIVRTALRRMATQLGA